MKIISGLAIAAALLLSWLCFVGTNPSAARHARAMADFYQFVATESGLRQNILNARLGLLRDYDPINAQMMFLHQLIDRFRENGVPESVLTSLEDVVVQQEHLTEDFKTNNALLQNSLAYFGLLSGRFGLGASNGALNAAISALATSVLHLMLDPSATSTLQVQMGLDRLAKETQPAEDQDLIDGLLIHGRVLHDLLPATDNLLQKLYDLPVAKKQENVRSFIATEEYARQSRANVYKLLLYLSALILLVLLATIGFRLNRLLQDLQRRARFEHAMAAISMRFVNARENELVPTVKHSLAELASSVGADRAYLIVSHPPQLYSWTSDGQPWLQDWPNQQPVRLPSMDGAVDDIRYYPSLAKMAPGADRDALLAAHLKGWFCMRASGADAKTYILGLEALTGPLTWPLDEIGLLRLAADTICNAVGRKNLEREQARLEASLQKARRMEAVGTLTSGVAHNFNNVIAAILGHAEMAETKALTQTQLDHHIQGIRIAAERARDLVEQILHFGRQKNSPLRHIPLKPLLEETEALLLAALPDDVHLTVAIGADDMAVVGDATQLQQIIINLCNNAQQALDGVGTIAIKAEPRTLANEVKLSHGTLSAGNFVCISVTDAGCGMNEATLARLFEPFFTNRAEGNGIGLATVYEIVTAYGGELHVSSRLGFGSSFEVWLPQAAQSLSADGRTPEAQKRGDGETVLIVNENPAYLLRDEEIVAALGYEPVGYADAYQAVDVCRIESNRFDIILISNVMPVNLAVSTAAELHKLTPGTPILLAASIETLEANLLAEAGVCEVVKTPLVSAELAYVLPRWLTEGWVAIKGNCPRSEA